MKIALIITGLTDMKGDYRCISGYDRDNQRYLRPLLSNARIDHDFTFQKCGEIKLFSKVTFRIDSFIDKPIPPHIEDFYIHYELSNVEDTFGSSEIKNFFFQIADPSIKVVYGNYIEIANGYPVIPKGCGNRSLGTIISKRCKVYKNDRGRVRVDFIDQTGYQLNNVPCVAHDSEYKTEGIYENAPIRLGLTRLWKKEGMEEEFYWIQVSGIFPNRNTVNNKV